MASNAEMRRLVLLAADRLADTPGDDYMAKTAIQGLSDSDRRMAVDDLRHFAASVALAEQTLRMVAACLVEDEPETSAGVSS